MITGRDVANKMLELRGTPYIFGYEIKFGVHRPKATDCSESIEWTCRELGVKPVMPDGSWYQFQHCAKHGNEISVDDAITTPGALLFYFSGDPWSKYRPRAAHVAVSLGNGKTIEARSSKLGTKVFSAYNRGWTHAALIPGVSYGAEWGDAQPKPPAPAPAPVPPQKKEEPVMGSTWRSVLRKLLSMVGIG